MRRNGLALPDGLPILAKYSSSPRNEGAFGRNGRLAREGGAWQNQESLTDPHLGAGKIGVGWYWVGMTKHKTIDAVSIPAGDFSSTGAEKGAWA